MHSRSHTYPFACLRPHCTERFETALEAWDHTLKEVHQFRPVYVCPIRTCATAVAGLQLDRVGACAHWKTQHKRPEAAGNSALGEMVRSQKLRWGGPEPYPLFFYLLRDVAATSFPMKAECRHEWDMRSKI